jgi:hypothetical protein
MLFLDFAVLLGIIYIAEKGLFLAWWLFAGYLSRLTLEKSFFYSLSVCVLSALSLALLIEQTFFLKTVCFYVVPVLCLSEIVKRKASIGVFLWSLLAFLSLFAMSAQELGFVQATDWQLFAQSFMNQCPMPGSVGDFFGSLSFNRWVATLWLPVDGALLAGTVLSAWYSLGDKRKKFDWHLSFKSLILLWSLLLVPSFMKVPLAIEASSKLAFVVLVIIGIVALLNDALKKTLKSFLKFNSAAFSLVPWLLLIVFVQWFFWILAGFGSLVLWREGFSDGSYST